MSNASNTNQETSNFDLFRVSKSKSVVDISPNTLKKYVLESKGAVNIYRRGKTIFASKSEVTAYIIGGKLSVEQMQREMAERKLAS